MNYEIKSIVSSIKKNGFFLLKNFLLSEDISKLKNFLDKDTKKNTRESFIPVSKMGIFKSIFNLDQRTFRRNLFIYKIKKKYNLENIASQIIGDKELYAIDSYKSKINTGMVIPWHTDQAYSGRKDVSEHDFVNPEKAAIKFFFYLTDVDSENGCLGYIPGSHKISFYLKRMILNKEIEYSPYWSLEDYRSLLQKNEVKSIILKYLTEEEIDKFLNNSSFLTNNNKDTNLFDIEAPLGSLLIFDESGVHRGAALKKSDRLCLRYFFRKKIN